MWISWTMLATSLIAQTPQAPDAAAPEDERPRMLVLELKLEGPFSQDWGQQVHNLMVTNLQRTGRYQVVSQADVITMLGVEEQRQLTGCSDESCMAEIGGALGAGWLVSGSVGQLGEGRLLTLKLIDVQGSRLKQQLTKRLPTEDSELPDAIESYAYELVGMEAPAPETHWYASPWLWGGVGVAVVGAGLLTFFLVRDSGPPSSNLGQVTF